jgi:RNA polymerase sigma factor (sigma-70 family)
MLPDDDGELMVLLQAGDERALDSLMQRWELPLRSFLYRSCPNSQDAEDLAQEAFVRVYQNRGKFRPGSKFSTWLFSIAVNLNRDRLRRMKVRKRVLLNESALESIPEDTAGGSPPGAALSLLQAETAATVRSAVQSLEEPLRSAVLLCEYEELATSEAASILGCSSKAIESRLYRARALLRKSLAGLFPK